jgi:hypothetical protein
LSSAILYLAIVAIWAVVLVPRWLRPRPAPPQPVPVPAEPAGARPGAAEPAIAQPAGAGTASAERGPPGQDAAPPWPAGAGWADARAVAPADDPAAPAAQTADGAAEEAALPSRRAEIVRARRRLLTTLVTLTVIAVALVVTRIDADWIVIPPAVLLAGYLALLRRFAHIDAERARRAARTRHAAARAGAGQEPASPEPLPGTPATGTEPDLDGAPEAPEAPGGAEIIDISGRIGDQVYDQYADAAHRAVGD